MGRRMSAKRYFLVVWLAFAAPWIAGTGLGVYAESQIPANDGPAALAGPCSAGASASVSMACPERTVASLAGHSIASAGRIVQMDSSRSPDTAAPVRRPDLMDVIFVLGPPLLLLIAYCALLAARLTHDIRSPRLGDAE